MAPAALGVDVGDDVRPATTPAFDVGHVSAVVSPLRSVHSHRPPAVHAAVVVPLKALNAQAGEIVSSASHDA